MIIFFGGLIGSGKTTIATSVAKYFNFYYYETISLKKKLYKLNSTYQSFLRRNKPLPDRFRSKIYSEFIKDFKRLSDKHEYLVCDEVLNSRALRRRLFSAAQKYYGGYIVIWVIAEDAVVKRRLLNIRRSHLLKDPLIVRESLKSMFDPIDEADLIVDNSRGLKKSLRLVNNYIKSRLRE